MGLYLHTRTRYKNKKMTVTLNVIDGSFFINYQDPVTVKTKHCILQIPLECSELALVLLWSDCSDHQTYHPFIKLGLFSSLDVPV